MNESRTNGPMYLRDSSGLDIVICPVIPTFVSGGERVVVYDGKRGFVTPDNYNWMKTATPKDIGGMRVMRITQNASDGWIPKAPKLESFRWNQP